MKKYIVTLFLIIPFLAFAEENKPTRYTAGFEIGSQFQISKPTNLNYTLKSNLETVLLSKGITTWINANFVNGFNLNDHIFLGAGVGIEYSSWEQLERYVGSFIVSNTDYNAINMPLFARFKVDFTTTKVSPFFQIDLGYNALLSTPYLDNGRSYKRGGILLSPALGIDFKFSETQKFYVNFQYVMQAQGENEWYYSNSIHSFGFKLGMLF